MSYYDISVERIPIGSSGQPVAGDPPVFTKELSDEEWGVAWNDRCCSDQVCHMAIRDNGSNGDGIWIEVKAESATIFHALIPDESLDTIIEAFKAIRRLRAAEETEDA